MVSSFGFSGSFPINSLSACYAFTAVLAPFSSPPSCWLTSAHLCWECWSYWKSEFTIYSLGMWHLIANRQTLFALFAHQSLFYWNSTRNNTCTHIYVCVYIRMQACLWTQKCLFMYKNVYVYLSNKKKEYICPLPFLSSVSITPRSCLCHSLPGCPPESSCGAQLFLWIIGLVSFDSYFLPWPTAFSISLSWFLSCSACPPQLLNVWDFIKAKYVLLWDCINALFHSSAFRKIPRLQFQQPVQTICLFLDISLLIVLPWCSDNNPYKRLFQR